MRSMRWVLLLLVLASCSSRSHAETDVGPEAERAFYYWRTTFALSARERTALADAQVTKLYVRTFDLDWNATENRAVVLGGLTASEPAPPGVEVVPVVFIKQDVFKHAGGARELAQLTWAEVSRRVKPLGVVPRELQLDCDWTDTTRDRFFAYVREVRAASHVALSATIRLHQIKYRERTGVPPVDRGMLMFYNMGSFSADVGSRAIFDPAIAEQYLGRVSSYPLALDLALPVWSWTLQLRDDMPVNLLQSTDPDELPAVDFLDAAGPDRFVATRSAFLHGAMIREGDILKIERMRPADTRAAGAQIAPHLPAGTRTISLFDLSERNLDRYGTDDLDQIFHAR